MPLAWIVAISPRSEQKEVPSYQCCRHNDRCDLFQSFNIYFLDSEAPLLLVSVLIEYCEYCVKMSAAPGLS